MNKLPSKKVRHLPANIDETHKFILIGREALNAYKAKIKAAEAVPESFANKEALIKETQAFAKELIDAWGNLGGMIENRTGGSRIRTAGGRFKGQESDLPPGLHKKESHLAQTIYNNPELVDQIEDKIILLKRIPTVEEIYREIKKIKPEPILPDPIFSEKWSVEIANIQTYQTDKKFDFIITDPPYPREYLYLYEILAKRAKEWLQPNGLVIAMCGQSYLNEIYKLMSSELIYYWTGCYLTPGQPTPLRQKQVNTSWKPILFYSLREYSGKTFGDVYKSNVEDKSFHEWGQSVSGMYSLINQICLPNQSIFDPFCGAGTTGVAALMNGCLFHGIDIDQECVEISKGRLTKIEGEIKGDALYG